MQLSNFIFTPPSASTNFGEALEVDLDHVVDLDAEELLHRVDHQRRAAEGVGGVDLLRSVAGDVGQRVARDRQPRRLAAAVAHQHDRVGAARALLARPAIRPDHEDVVGAREHVAAVVERPLHALGHLAGLDLGADHEQVRLSSVHPTMKTSTPTSTRFQVQRRGPRSFGGSRIGRSGGLGGAATPPVRPPCRRGPAPARIPARRRPRRRRGRLGRLEAATVPVQEPVQEAWAGTVYAVFGLIGHLGRATSASAESFDPGVPPSRPVAFL